MDVFRFSLMWRQSELCIYESRPSYHFDFDSHDVTPIDLSLFLHQQGSALVE